MKKGSKMSEESKQKISKAKMGNKVNLGRKWTEEQKQRMSKAHIGIKHTEESKLAISKAHKKNKKLVGIKQSEETIEKRRKALSGRKRPKDVVERIKETCNSPEYKQRMSERFRGENNPAWRGGVSFEPYCHLFNDDLKERVREFFGRECVYCGMSENENGMKLAVHHVNYDKQACCSDGPPEFVATCLGCNAKANYDREEWEELFGYIIQYVYNGKCYYTKEEMNCLKKEEC